MILIYPITLVFASLLAVVDACGKIYFYTKHTLALGDHVSIVIVGGSSLDVGMAYKGVYAIPSVSLRAALPTLICCVLNVINTVTLCNRFYKTTGLPTAKTGRLKHNMICSNVASFSLINSLLPPIVDFYILFEQEMRQKSMAIAYIKSAAEILFSVSTGAVIAYLCLLCPDLCQVLCSRQKHTTQPHTQSIKKKELCPRQQVSYALAGPSGTEASVITLG